MLYDYKNWPIPISRVQFELYFAVNSNLVRAFIYFYNFIFI